MKTATREYLVVTHRPVFDDDGNEVEPTAWRVALHCSDGIDRRIPHNFARQKDAEMAKAALEREGLTTKERILANKSNVRRIMLEALQW